MSYEEKYKDALEKARAFYETKSPDCLILESIFPELCEPEDERIRKDCIKYLDWEYQHCSLNEDKMKIEKCIAWLEKQGEQKYDVPDSPIKDSEVVTSRMKYIDENLKPIAEFVMDYANWDLRKDEWNHPVATVPLFRVLDALVQKGKQYSEGYSVVDNNTEPKFKTGDWVVYKHSLKIYQVYSIDNSDHNYIKYSCKPLFSTNEDWPCFHEDMIRHWTIEDAKDGDVLAFDWTQDNGASHWQKIVIFKGLNKDGIEGYGNTFKNGKLVLQEEVPHYSKTWTMTLQPATKEQRDILFQKISEAGYTWDAEKKQLTKNI